MLRPVEAMQWPERIRTVCYAGEQKIIKAIALPKQLTPTITTRFTNAPTLSFSTLFHDTFDHIQWFKKPQIMPTNSVLPSAKVN
ncbi:hypothetical protein GCM10007877_21520 [Marinibactrum halimedae]|uniref:Uncharacterized protein n=1 Tax=Marinibactrum halimedae TaxID=1444977 RepID=A0AA37WNR9_9GAMM|nr:hypothetical protein GCM10007877_21520 [Marinibactrum halimedae]